MIRRGLQVLWTSPGKYLCKEVALDTSAVTTGVYKSTKPCLLAARRCGLAWKTMPCTFRQILDSPASGSCPCQFVVPEGELVEFDGRTWCRFHLPLKVGAATSVKAGWIEEEIAAFNEDVFLLIDVAKNERDTANISGVVFPGEFSLERYKETKERLPAISFHQATFVGEADFSGVSFGQNVIFDGASFDNYAGFANTNFGGDARFNKTSFRSLAWFEKANFRGDTWFREAIFCGDAVFREASFRDGAWFEKASFRGNVAKFTKASFGLSSHFLEVSFRGNTGFEQASFGRFTWFRRASFHGTAGFEQASFNGTAGFEQAKFNGIATFSDAGESVESGAATFRSISFAHATFVGPTRFHNRKFPGPTDFRGTRFHRAPEFHNCVLHQDTVFPQAWNFRDHGGEKAARAYRTLKHAMANVHTRGEEAKFYALEQESLLHDPDTPIPTKVFSWLYRAASDYGQSVTQPIVGLLVTFFAFFVFYVVFLGIHLDPFPRSVWSLVPPEDVLRFALQQVFQPFEVFSARSGSGAPRGAILKALPEVPLPLACLAALHSVVTLSFLALFLLALRRRFKLD